ncbi:MAG: PPOX class F420-dependent oxidoreductase [Chloroflexota bacterium]|jgi:pyridoxamine 5'-phosphate oxidase family protein|nr:PPOX class F420-dependent oxidoreductase [Chloroflexota bacterium]
MPRTTFSDAEITYLDSQMLARIATVNPHGAPRVVPTGFRYNADAGTIDCGGFDLAATQRWQDVQDNPAVAIVIDDLASVNPWTVHGVQVRGTATLHEEEDESEHRGPGFNGAWMRITPTSISSWGLDSN